jgi:large subunit ribosomal protein L30
MSQEKKATNTQKKSSKKKDSKKQSKESDNKGGKLALILIRGRVGIRFDIKDTLNSLNLLRKHACVIIDDNKVTRGMVVKCKDYITYGEIESETIEELTKTRGKKTSEGKTKKFFSLAPPKGGFERKGIKVPFKKGGALGYRGKKISDLIKKML